ncbi:DUF4186 family protein [Halobacteriovorax sp. JY17]|uniref:DUF4186 family protein n=1 Tax=Halobacteriovorax sp. JY17 TaxID=2014617 RepID=UPI000C585C1E|nr:DUF4186 family protein [Halobacteriovorax sp. JY17]PIK13707.1 MAG: DUF4186 domain-containing protein [Halobacteriovorax sp. JY17]
MSSLENRISENIYFTDIFRRLGCSKVCSKFKLEDEQWDYLSKRGFDTILLEGRSLIVKIFSEELKTHSCKLAPVQTHPIFTALHATGTCCRSSLQKWHKIPKDKELKEKDIFYILLVVKEWIIRQEKPNHLIKSEKSQLSLFCS